MLNWGEIERLQAKADRVVLAQKPPPLRLLTLEDDETPPADWLDDEWGMIVRIEAHS
jgi:hypothetical protein